MSTNKSIRDFFKPPQAVEAVKAPDLEVASVKSLAFKIPQNLGPSSSSLSNSQPRLLADRQQSRGHQEYTSSLSSPPSNLFSSSPPIAHLKETVAPTPSRPLPDEIKASDDEEDDSDSSLEALKTVLAMKSPAVKMKDDAPRSPSRSNKHSSAGNFHRSPSPVQPKHTFDMSKLVSYAEEDEATEANSKRLKGMFGNRSKKESAITTNNGVLSPRKFTHGKLLDSVVAEKEDVDSHKVKRAIRRTEATVTEERWYFFDTQSSRMSEQRTFPIKAVTQGWKLELGEASMRQQTFISGFAEDMVAFGKQLPDEIFLWVLDEMCYETNDPLRFSYLNVLTESTEQAHRLITPAVIQRVFRLLGGTMSATNISESIRPVKLLGDPYEKRDWSNLSSVFKLLGQIAKCLQQEARTQAICILLRLCVDRVVLENLDLVDRVQEALRRLCKYTSDEDWESFCQYVSKILYDTTDLAMLRLQIVECISSVTPQTHDLRRRLAMCFFFDDLSYSEAHSHIVMDIDAFMDRLEDSVFLTNAQTDYRELFALVALLDIAIDDGRPIKLDLKNKKIEKRFNEDVDDFCIMIKGIMKQIGNVQVGYLSKVETKEILELVAQRISDTVRTRPMPKETWIDQARGRTEDLETEKKAMARFVAKVNPNGNGASKAQ